MLAAIPATAHAAPAAENPEATPARAHDLPSPLSDKQRDLRQKAVQDVVAGKKTPHGKNQVVEVSEGQYVELEQEASDAIWTVLGDFSDVQHNQIPKPERSVDNTT